MGDNLPLVDLGIESRVKNVVTGYWRTCALLFNDNVKCWGHGNYGQLGSADTQDIIVTGEILPTLQININSYIKLLSGGRFHFCIVYDDLITYKCVGNNEYGQLGQGDTNNRGDSTTTIFSKIPAINLGTRNLKISSIHSGGNFNCVVFEMNQVKWGKA